MHHDEDEERPRYRSIFTECENPTAPARENIYCCYCDFSYECGQHECIWKDVDP